jgi:nitroreductase
MGPYYCEESHAMELLEAILKRRSVRKFNDYAITDEELRLMLEAARIAPSWSNTQPWEFIVVRDRDLINKIADTYAEGNPATKCTRAANVLIAACAKKGVSGCYGGKESTILPNWYMFDLGLAVQNLMLRAHELGLGTVVVGLLDHARCQKELGLPDDYQVVAILPVGKPAVTGKDGPPRKELKDFVHKDRFGVKLFS